MAEVSTPYNFVPLNEKVFFPSWANFVNHDVPFKDGLSGHIKLEITTESPIFIRKPYEEGDDFYESKEKIKISKEFCHIKDKNDKKCYYIPGSSIRNMLRSVVEIMSFSKLDPEYFNNEKVKKHTYLISKAVENIQRDYNNKKLDMAETIFGRVLDEEKLKGRVSIDHAFSDNAIVENDYKIVLASPKNTFSPFYIKQKFDETNNYNIDADYSNLDKPDVIINGRKRYPLHELNIDKNKASQKQEKISTHIKPLKSQTIFSTKLRYHNLKPSELGVLLSAITFHNNTKCRHSIGTGKPFGLGEITIKILNKANLKENVEYMRLFEEEISKKIENWSKTTQLIELFTMSSTIAKGKFKNYQYMALENFKKIEIEKKALPKYSTIVGYKETITSLLKNNVDLELNTQEILSYSITDINKKIKKLSLNETDLFNLEEGEYLGIVKFFNNTKGFGFIKELKSNEDYFVHISNLCEGVILKEKDSVIFELKEGKKGKGKVANKVELYNK